MKKQQDNAQLSARMELEQITAEFRKALELKNIVRLNKLLRSRCAAITRLFSADNPTPVTRDELQKLIEESSSLLSQMQSIRDEMQQELSDIDSRKTKNNAINQAYRGNRPSSRIVSGKC